MWFEVIYFEYREYFLKKSMSWYKWRELFDGVTDGSGSDLTKFTEQAILVALNTHFSVMLYEEGYQPDVKKMFLFDGSLIFIINI